MQVADRVGRRIKLQDLNILMTVVQTGSMLKAAERLNTAQPAISRSIAELEHVLGVRLLDRHRKGVEPTEYGRALLDCGATVFDALRQGVKSIEFLADAEAGEVRIGAIAPLALGFVTAVIDRLSRRYPRIVVHLVSKNTDALHRELSERNVDLLIGRRFSPIADERQDFEPLFEDPYVVAASTQNPWTRRRKVALSDLVNELWALPGLESPPWSAAMEAFRASGLDYPRTTVFTALPDVRMRLMATGRFLAIFPASALRFSTTRTDFKVLPVELPLARTEIGVVILKNRTLSPAARLFIELAREVAKPLAKEKR